MGTIEIELERGDETVAVEVEFFIEDTAPQGGEAIIIESATAMDGGPMQLTDEEQGLVRYAIDARRPSKAELELEAAYEYGID